MRNAVSYMGIANSKKKMGGAGGVFLVSSS